MCSSYESSEDELEILDTFVPPTERKSTPKTPSRKRPAPSSSGVGCASSPAAKRTPKSASVKREKAEASIQASKNAPKIVLGLDFGTTFTGLAYSCLDKLDQISVLMDLDDSNQDNPKVPSAIQFARCGDGSINILWGNDAERTAASTIEWFKLLLVDEDDLPEEVRTSEHVSRARTRLHDLDMTCEEVIASYLRALWKNCLEKLRTEVAVATVEQSRFHVVVTLPAICEYIREHSEAAPTTSNTYLIGTIGPDYSRERMLQAVKAADVLQKREGVADTILTFVSEPEAAALATLKRVDGRCDVIPGDCFVVCDCGGGTVDLIAYQVTSVEPMMIREIVKGAGALAGAVFVDARFKLLLKQKFDEINPGLWEHLTPDEIEDIMSEDWQKMRIKFTGNPARDPIRGFTVRVPAMLYAAGLLHAENELKKIQITPEDLKEVFRPVLEKIESLVFGQVKTVVAKKDQDPKYIILVGGFGRCKYLYEWLKTRTGGIEVLQSQGAEPWTAIFRGAVIHGMAKEKVDSRFGVEVQSRIARASYGIVCHEVWDKNMHLPEDKHFDEQEQLWKSTNRMKWLVREGDDVAANKTFRHEFYRLIDVNKIPRSLSTSIWMCRTSPPPLRKDESVVKHSEMKWSAKIDWSRLPQHYNEAEEVFYRLEYQAELKCSAGVADLALLHKGKRQATRNVQVEYFDKADV